MATGSDNDRAGSDMPGAPGAGDQAPHTHGYLNAASHGIPAPAVYQRMQEYLHLEYNVGPARAWRRVADEYHSVRLAMATLIDADPSALAFATSGTRAWIDVVDSLDLAGGRVLAAPNEWGANLRALEARGDLQIERLPALSTVAPDLTTWTSRFDDDVRALVVPVVSSLSGERYPVEAIGALTRPQGCAYIVDAAQALGQMPVSVKTIGCDALAAPTRKWLRGPRGTAIAWRRLDAGQVGRTVIEHASDFDVVARLGLGAAARLVTPETITPMQHHIMGLARDVRQLAAERGVTCLSPAEPHSGITTLALPLAARPAVTARLQASDCQLKWLDPNVEEPLAKLKTDGCALLRLSAHHYNSRHDLSVALDAIAAGIGESLS